VRWAPAREATLESFRIGVDVAWRLPLLIIGVTDSRSSANLDDEGIDLRFGFTRIRIPYADIRDLRQRDWSWLLGVGIRIAGDRTLGLIGSTRGVVQIALKAPTVRGVLFMRHPRNVAVSLEEPMAFIEAVRLRMPA
jgi:hypothetical protein